MDIPDSNEYPLGPNYFEVTDGEFEILNSNPSWFEEKIKALADLHTIDYSHPHDLRDLPVMLPREEVIPLIAEKFTREGYAGERAIDLAREHVDRLQKPIVDMVEKLKNAPEREKSFEEKLKEGLE